MVDWADGAPRSVHWFWPAPRSRPSDPPTKPRDRPSARARLAERSLLATLRPLLIVAEREDPGHEIQFADGRVLEMKPGEALFRPEGEVIYLALSLRNVGTGIAHLRGYRLEPETQDRVRADPLGPARHRRGNRAPDPATFADQQPRPLRRAGRYRVLAGHAARPWRSGLQGYGAGAPKPRTPHGRCPLWRSGGWPTNSYAIRFASRPRRDLALRHCTPLAKPRPRRVARAPAAEATAGAVGRQADREFVPAHTVAETCARRAGQRPIRW